MSRVVVVHDPWCAEHDPDGEMCASESRRFAPTREGVHRGEAFLVAAAGEPTTVAVDLVGNLAPNLELDQAQLILDALDVDPVGLREALRSLLTLAQVAAS
jgi:hypothetical protein